MSIKKDFPDKKSHPMLELTDNGRTAFKEYRNLMKRKLDELPGL